MHAIKGKYRNGQIILAENADWPEDTEVLVEPVETTIGMSEDQWLDTPDAIADWLRWYDSIQPPWLSPEEEAEWRAALQAQKDYEKSTFEAHAQKLQRLFE
jgi:hypothetical protein